MNHKESAATPRVYFTFEDAEDAWRRFNMPGYRHSLVKELARNNPVEFRQAAYGNPQLLRDLITLCPEAIVAIDAVAETLARLYRDAGCPQSSDKEKTRRDRARKLLARLIPRNPGGRKPFPQFIIVQLWRHCHSTARELLAVFRAQGRNVDNLLASEPWLQDFMQRHYGERWRSKLEEWLGSAKRKNAPAATIGLHVASKILGILSPESVRKIKQSFQSDSLSFWADLPIGGLYAPK